MPSLSPHCAAVILIAPAMTVKFNLGNVSHMALCVYLEDWGVSGLSTFAEMEPRQYASSPSHSGARLRIARNTVTEMHPNGSHPESRHRA